MKTPRFLDVMLTFLAGSLCVLAAESGYRLPPPDVVNIVDAPPPPASSLSPRGDALLLVASEANPPIAWVARPIHRLAGLRIDAGLGIRQELSAHTGITIVRLNDGRQTRVALPDGARIGFPVWAYDGKRFAFSRSTDAGMELWIADAQSGRASVLKGVRLNDVLGAPFQWLKDSSTLLLRLVPNGRSEAPAPPRAPSGPVIEETSGKVAKLRTFQDLLKSPHDAELFAHFAAAQLATIEVESGRISLIGSPDFFADAEFSPDERHLLVTRLKQPFSLRVPYDWFARRTEVLDPKGVPARLIADLPVSDDVPPQGVPIGPRAVAWQPLHPARLLWVEALDGGDPLKKVPHRDALFIADLADSAPPKEVLRIQHRFTGLAWLPTPDHALLSEYDRDRRWRTVARLNLARAAETRKVLFDLSVSDVYRDPGQPLRTTRPDGQSVIIQDGDWIYLAGAGATPKGDQPFLDRFNLASKATERLFHSSTASLERVEDFVGESRDTVLLSHESPTEPRNLFRHNLKTGERQRLSDYRDPAPQLTGVKRELLKYRRSDGVELSGMLYLPVGHQPGQRLPTLIWAYPREYSDPGTAGQVRSAPNGFTFYQGTSPLLFLTQGYAVLMNATMPVVGDPETMNDTFVEQVVASAKAAVDTLVDLGVTDRDRILVSGHSYGAFMTATLLAHSDLFAAGIARSGAYNRTLTPFGFQSERRSLWEAPEVYARVSPFMHAPKINEPLLLLHGEADNNSGTFPMQSERLYDAVRGAGGTARLVLLPHESHAYRARESVLHVLAEMFDWADRHVKNRPATPTSPQTTQ